MQGAAKLHHSYFKKSMSYFPVILWMIFWCERENTVGWVELAKPNRWNLIMLGVLGFASSAQPTLNA